MDSRRLPRAVIDPKVRQVGFFTSGDPPQQVRSQFIITVPNASTTTTTGISVSSPVSDISLPGNSLSPVMIPPLRHVSIEGLPSNVGIPVPGHTSPRRCRGMPMPIGSYNPSESFMGISSTLSPSSSQISGSDFSEVATMGRLGRTGSGKAASSFPGSTGEMMMAVKGSENALANSMLKAALAVKTSPGVSEDGEIPTETTNEGAGAGRKQKQTTTRAERRAIQEAQRAAKAAAREDGKGNKFKSELGDGATPISNHDKVIKPPQRKDVTQDTGAASERRTARNTEKDRKKDIPQPQMQFDDKNRVDKAKRRAIVNQSEARNRVDLFRHLPQFERGPQLPYLESNFFHLDYIHPSVYKVGLQYLSWTTTGGNARCKEMLLAFREAIIDYSTPPKKVLIRDLTSKIGSYVSFLIECRPLSVSMGNAIRFLKNRVAKLHHNLSESEAKSHLISDIDRFINDKIIVADKVIVRHAFTKIRDGDVLLIYGYSSVVEMILLHAHDQGKQFRVVVVDSRPSLEGKTLLHKLVVEGLSCTYTHINAISYIMHEVRCVFLGASSVLANGTIFSRVGTACVAMVAHAFGVPVLICCEAYKFHERVQLDSICSNELGNPDVIANVSGEKNNNHLANWPDHKNLQLLNLLYDVTPSDYVSMIVTEHGMVPPTSVPVIVREYGTDQFLF